MCPIRSIGGWGAAGGVGSELRAELLVRQCCFEPRDSSDLSLDSGFGCPVIGLSRMTLKPANDVRIHILLGVPTDNQIVVAVVCQLAVDSPEHHELLVTRPDAV